MEQYDLVRQRYSDTAADHVELAKWCQAAKLHEQRRAHLIRALRIDPENVYAHQALGHRKSGYDWISPDQTREAEKREKQINSSLKEFGLTMRTIASELGSEKSSIAMRAEQKFAKIRDSRSIPAMEAAFSNASLRSIESGIVWLSSFTNADAGHSLMRFAIFHESDFVRELAAQQLLKRDPYEFVPSLIELVTKIVTGDLVLSENIRTGELAWKSVIEPTRRPSSALLTIKAGHDELRCTHGHVFWVSGHGWRKASELIPGQVLHSAKLPVVIDHFAEAGAAETYNLIVSDNANYFVGKQLILSHDYTSRSSAPEVVPGYIPSNSTQ